MRTRPVRGKASDIVPRVAHAADQPSVFDLITCLYRDGVPAAMVKLYFIYPFPNSRTVSRSGARLFRLCAAGGSMFSRSAA